MAGKNYKSSFEKVDHSKLYDYKEALALAKSLSTTSLILLLKQALY